MLRWKLSSSNSEADREKIGCDILEYNCTKDIDQCSYPVELKIRSDNTSFENITGLYCIHNSDLKWNDKDADGMARE